MKGIFITGTDTGIGKTVITGLLARFLKDKGYRVVTQKWVQTGGVGFSEDIATHFSYMGIGKKEVAKYLSCISPYVFNFAASPHLAAKLEKRKISSYKIRESFKFLKREFDFVIVEGVGGALVPFNRKELIVDIAQGLRLPTIVVAANRLGAINQTLLTLESLKLRKIKILGVIYNGDPSGQKRLILEDNPKIINDFSNQDNLGCLPWNKDKKILQKHFKTLGERIIGKIK